MKRVSLALLTVLAAGMGTSPGLGAQVRTTPQGMALNFVDARLADVIRSLGLSLGLNIILTDVPNKRITFTTATAVEKNDVNAILESILESNGLVLIQKGAVAQVMPVERAPAQSPRTYVLTLKYASAEDLAASLGKLFGNTIVAGDSRSLDDKSLSRNLDTFRQREAQVFQMRRDPPITAGPSVTPGASDASQVPATGNGKLLGETIVVADLPSNSLIVRTIPGNYPLIRETVAALDVRPAQVLLEVLVAEIALDKTQQFGIDWSTVDGKVTTRFGTPLFPDSGTVTDDFLLRVVTLDRFKVRAVLRAIATRSDVRILSTPQILASNNREAHILVGSKVPFVVASRLGFDIAIDRTVQFQDVGTSLIIIPTINQDDYVSVQILQEVSTLTSQTIPSALNAPVISTREASTRATIRDGQTVVIGGLIGDSRETLDLGVPFLKDIPLIGNLFKRQSRNRNRTELAIFVTPFIVRTDETADALRERIRKRMEESSPGLFKDPRADSIPGRSP
ncbi:MAG: hypothetical protein H0T21_04665 [Gemmatimonadaceae bacterium]|nr:hypothetical protein [Gemmatimonadaceae bacterium]